MRKLILIKHARPQVIDTTPAHEWHLSEEGRKTCATLADALRPDDPEIILTSDETKALETGELVGAALGKQTKYSPDLHEHDRSNVPMMASREFLSLLALFFKDPTRRILGKETAAEAQTRFQRAIDDIVVEYPTGNIAVITHGTVLALFGAAHGAGDGFGLYRKLGLPSIMRFSLPDFGLLEVVDRLG